MNKKSLIVTIGICIGIALILYFGTSISIGGGIN